LQPEATITVAGFTSAPGSEEFNRELSQNRAESVKSFLVERGIPSDRIATVGYGEDRPIATNETSAGRAMNRRVEIVVEPSTAIGGGPEEQPEQMLPEDGMLPEDDTLPDNQLPPVDQVLPEEDMQPADPTYPQGEPLPEEQILPEDRMLPDNDIQPDVDDPQEFEEGESIDEPGRFEDDNSIEGRDDWPGIIEPETEPGAEPGEQTPEPAPWDTEDPVEDY
jgi:hypothetical protein